MSKLIFVFLSVSVLAQSNKDSAAFRPAAADTYPSVQTTGKVKLAAVKYESDEETRAPFGKTNPNEFGVLPVLLIVKNDGDSTLLLDRMEVSYQAGRNKVEPVPVSELPYVIAPKRPNMGPKYPIPRIGGAKKNPLAAVEFETRSWAAKSVMKGESAHGFFYFNTRHLRNAVLYVTGLRDADSELFFVEIPLDSPK